MSLHCPKNELPWLSILFVLSTLTWLNLRAVAAEKPISYCCPGNTENQKTEHKPADTKNHIASSNKRVLRVAADPNNLPFSNERGEGIENKLAELIAESLQAEMQYVWHAQRRGFFRETILKNKCDLVLGVPADFKQCLVSEPYYRSSYVFLRKSDQQAPLRSLDDTRLKTLKIGVQAMGDGNSTPPTQLLQSRGIVENLQSFSMYQDYAAANPTLQMVDALHKDEIDVAVAWGPLAGYFAKQQKTKLDLQFIDVDPQKDEIPLTFSISVGVAKAQSPLLKEINEVLRVKRTEIEKLLDDYGMPRLPLTPKAGTP
jgi:mxaJ protein